MKFFQLQIVVSFSFSTLHFFYENLVADLKDNMKKKFFKLIVCFNFLLTFIACSSLRIERERVQTPEEIEDTIRKDSIILWCELDWIKVNEFEIMYFPYMGKTPTLGLNNNGSYEGFSSCNSFLGKYTIDGKNINFESPTSSSKLCHEVMIIEKTVFSALRNINNYIIENNQLLLKRDDEILMVYNINQ